MLIFPRFSKDFDSDFQAFWVIGRSHSLKQKLQKKKGPKYVRVTKIDIVKPIPAKSPTPKIDFQFKSDGSLQSPKVTAKSAKRKIPKGLPTIRPSAIPKLLFSVNVCEMSPLKTIAVLANANIGKIIKATGLCRKCCKIYEVDFSPPLPNGMANANKTPVIVAWTPEWSIKYHIATPPIK